MCWQGKGYSRTVIRELVTHTRLEGLKRSLKEESDLWVHGLPPFSYFLANLMLARVTDLGHVGREVEE